MNLKPNIVCNNRLNKFGEGSIFFAFLCFLLFSGFLNSSAQTVEDKKDLFENAEFFYNSEDYQEAVYYYLKLHDEQPENGNFNYHIGSCYLNIPGQERKSISYFEQALPKVEEKLNSANFKSSLEQDKAPLHTYFFLAQAYRMTDQMDKALEMLDKFSNSLYFEGKYNESMVTAEFEACKKAQIVMERPISVDFYNLGPAINNSNENYNPVLNQDSSLIIYMNNLKFYNAIFMARRVNGKWEEAENITPQVGSDGDSYPCFLSADGQTLLLVKKVKRNSDLFISHYVHDKWSLMQPLNENINTRWNETHASLSPDGKTLYFASDRKGTFGGLDLWYAELQSDGQWGKAMNLGPDINTKLDEDNPFVSSDGQVLFFVSQGHLNMGGFDIFYSKKSANKWSNPVNLGYPVNTTIDDKFYFPMGKGNIAYMARRMSTGFGLQDIYRLTITAGDPMNDLDPDYLSETRNQVSESRETKNTPASKDTMNHNNISSTDYSSKANKERPVSDTNASNSVVLDTSSAATKNSDIEKITADSGMSNAKNLTIINATGKQDLPVNKRSPEARHITGILFAFSSSIISQQAANQLNTLLAALRSCMDLEINIRGYADSKGSDEANKAISLKRSESVAKYLIDRGINPKRLHVFSEGSQKPVAQNTNANGSDNPEGRKYNRRVEFDSQKTLNSCLVIDMIDIPSRLKIK